jgi:hypothetical protein
MTHFPLTPVTTTGAPTPMPPETPTPSPPPFAALGLSAQELTGHDVPPLAALCRAKVDFAAELRDAAIRKDYKKIKNLIECGADPNTVIFHFPHPISILGYACVKGRAELVDILLRLGATPSFVMMAKAFAAGHDDVVRILSKYVDINTLDATGMSLLHRACLNVDAAAVDRLLKLGADIHLPSRDGFPPLVLAFRLERANPDAKSTVMAKLLDAGASIEAGHAALTPLTVACLWNNLDALTFLLGRGANPNAVMSEGGATPLAFCCRGAVNVAIFDKVLDAGGRMSWDTAMEQLGSDDHETVLKRAHFILATFLEITRPIASRYSQH